MARSPLYLAQHRAAKCAEFALKQKFERLEWERDVLDPYLERVALEANTTLELPELSIMDDDDANSQD